ncbi:MAG TPA: hypothetical protein VM166_10935, partial [Gemmatimonadaceae bacterium]|nr:hypothetical protein [Gemmatimonadaceae bacterium]
MMRRARTACGAAALVLFVVTPRVTLAQPGSLLAVSNEAGRSLSLIDTRSLKVLGTIALPQRPRGIEFSPDGKLVFVALSDPQTKVQSAGDGIVAINIASRRIVATFPAGTDPERFAITPDG